MADFPIYCHVRYDTELNKNGKPEIVCKDVSDHDFVEVVRCKDCKYYKESKLLGPTKFCYFYQIGTGLNTADDDFCSKGESREEKRKMTELTKEIEQAIAQIGEELGAEMIVHNCISVGAKKEIGGETFGDYTILTDSAIEDGRWRYDLNRFENRAKITFGIEKDEELSKEGG